MWHWTLLAPAIMGVALAEYQAVKWSKMVTSKMMGDIRQGLIFPTVELPEATINWKSPPMMQAIIPEDTCLDNIGSCRNVLFFRREEFVNDPVPAAFEPLKSLLNNEPRHKVSVFATRKVESFTRNEKDSPFLLRASKSQPILHYPAPNWHMVANLDQGNKLILSNGTARDASFGRAIDVRRQMKCPPKSVCYIETFTFHASLKGFCRKRPTVMCGNENKEINVCNALDMPSRRNQLERGINYHNWSSCDQFDKFIWESCYQEPINKCIGPLAKECQVLAPILWRNRPLSVSVAWSQDIEPENLHMDFKLEVLGLSY
ncbi:hypothetical protein GQ602_003615 [Ophiocordyceps camponoti-floridani]|uniref:Uncharacterized protein n=1 Tax=Ophiocordyceps camponoti-floridani TaxID=2030778 RepID=A0A8H4VEL1_9HYPO|nr:hypothetical protein GQ602_003615 [Ophiocordyceps camponoti-floridani]